MNISYATGKGHFTDNEGKDVVFPINLLILSNGTSTIEIKLDKISNKLLPYMFDMTPTDMVYESDNGYQLEHFYLNDKNSVDVKVK